MQISWNYDIYVYWLVLLLNNPQRFNMVSDTDEKFTQLGWKLSPPLPLQTIYHILEISSINICGNNMYERISTNMNSIRYQV